MSASFNTNPGIDYSPLSSHLATENNPEQWLEDLASFTETLSSGLTRGMDEATLSNAVASVERNVRGLRVIIETGSDEELKQKVKSGVSAALKTICSLASSIEKTPENKLPMISRVLDVGEHLLHCHKLITEQKLVQAFLPVPSAVK